MFLRALKTLSILVLILFIVGGAIIFVLDGYSSTVLSEKYAQAPVDQCSRGFPRDIDGGWTPSKREIEEMEGKLRAFLEGVPAQSKLLSPPQHLREYKLQYVGILKRNERLIYINAIHKDAAVFGFWVFEPIFVCDGGSLFWGAVYNPATKEFFGYEQNGPG